MQVRYGLKAAVRCVAAPMDWMSVCSADRAGIDSAFVVIVVRPHITAPIGNIPPTEPAARYYAHYSQIEEFAMVA